MDSYDSLLYVKLHKIQITIQLKIIRVVFGVNDDFKPVKAFFTTVFF